MKRGKNVNPTHFWTEEEIEWLRVNYPIYEQPELLVKFNEHFNLNVTFNSLKATLLRYKIISGRSGQWQKGHAAHNKGLTWDEYMPKESQVKCRKTCFSSEDRSINNSNHNELPVGTEALDGEGYVMVKIDSPTGISSRRWWKLKHHLIWEQHHGPVPKGMNVIFADGDKYNFDINNLILVSDAELGVMNKDKLYFKGNGDATKVGHKIAKINLRIKEVENGRKEHTK